MRASAALSVAQLSHADACATGAGTGAAHNQPNTASTMDGTQIQCSSSLVGFWWLAPYSSSQSLTLRMRGDATRGVRPPQGHCGLDGRHQAAQLSERARLDLT